VDIVRIIGELSKDRYDVKVVPWKLLLETNRYYEIKPEQGAVKRIYKEKLNTATIETKQYANGTLCCSAFCTKDRIEELQRVILKQLQTKVIAYLEDLKLNQIALNRQQVHFKA